MKRSYVKKSNYWNKFDPDKSFAQISNSSTQSSWKPELCGEPFYVSTSSLDEVSKAYARADSSNSNGTRINRTAINKVHNRFSSIRNGMLPYSYCSDGVNVREAIELCQKAYAGVAVFRNAIDIMSEFANTEIYFDGGSKKSQDFFSEWFKRIKIWKLTDQYFREYYRSGNVFLYRVDAKFRADDYANIVKQIGDGTAKENKIPVKYILINPYDIIAKNASNFDSNGVYEKVLSQYDIARLKNPTSQEDIDVFKGLPAQTQKDIKSGGYVNNGVRIQLDPERILFSFYKKQDYEPFAIPFGYPVLEDINAKLELKKIDQAITRTVENVILLITMGTEPEKGGINQQNVDAMQNLFRNESVGRVLVSDYTTKAQFIIPDLNKVLGPEKYQVLNEDIKQGLQNIVVGEEKFSSTEVKAQIFIDRLKEARNAFINDVLQPEIVRISQNLGLKNYPTVKFRDIDIRDQTQLMRVTTRLMELGIMTPQQGMEMFKTGQFPKAEEIAPAQDEFVTNRQKGYYNPIVGGVPEIAAPEDPNAAPTVNKTNKTAGRPEGTVGIPLSNANVSIASVKSVFGEIDNLRLFIENELIKKDPSLEMTEARSKMVEDLAQSIVQSENINKWNERASLCVNNFDNIALLSPAPEVLSSAEDLSLDDLYLAAIMHHSKTWKL